MLMEREGKIEARMEAQRQETKAKLEQQEAKIEQQRQEMEVKMEQQRQENATLREQAMLREHQTLEAKLVAAVESKVGALQSRVQVLYAAQLLADEELYRLEEIIADGCEAAAGGGEGGEDQVGKMIVLSERMAADGAFSLQLRRKFM